MNGKNFEEIARTNIKAWTESIEHTQKVITGQIEFQKDLVDRVTRQNIKLAEETGRHINDAMVELHGIWREFFTQTVNIAPIQ